MFTRMLRVFVGGSLGFGLAGALSSCTSGDDTLFGDGNAGQSGASSGSGSLGQAGALGGPFGGGASAVGTAGRSMVDAGSGGGAQGGLSGVSGSSAGGVANGETCSDVPPNNGDTCMHALAYGWCSQTWLGESCRQACGKCAAGTAGTSSGSGGVSSSGGSSSAGAGGQPPVIEGGAPGWASRYWDCCKPACGWKANVPGGSTPVHSCSEANQSLGGNYDTKNACDGDQNGAYMCGNFGPWAVSDTLAYGFAAVKMGSDYCGKCYEVQFTGSSHGANNDPGSQALRGKTMIVQAINTGGVDPTQFDLLIPGGGVGDFDACSSQWGSSDLGERYGGFYLACQKAHGFKYAEAKACAAQKCQSVLGGKPDLLAGCNFFVNWLGAPDNPNLVYKEVTCPAAITQLSGLKR